MEMPKPQKWNTVGGTQSALIGALVPVAAEEAAFQARLLLCHALELDVSGLLLARERTLTPAETARVAALLERRLAGEPLQYILGEWEFMGLPFYVEEGVLIPRQDTETLAEAALAYLRGRQGASVLDLCCGSGCIGVSLAKLSDAEVTLADISSRCLGLAKRNAARNGVAVRLIETDLFSALPLRYDLIVCNPPYIPTAEIGVLQSEVQREPHLALDGGEDGLDFYRRIAACCGAHLLSGGRLMLEVGAGQADAVQALFSHSSVLQDLSGIERVVIVQAP